jgi:hypothetical protein
VRRGEPVIVEVVSTILDAKGFGFTPVSTSHSELRAAPKY